MKLHYFFGCILAAASLALWPEIGLAHGGGGHGGGGGGRAFVGDIKAALVTMVSVTIVSFFNSLPGLFIGIPPILTITPI
jgi:hypothetical protein